MHPDNTQQIQRVTWIGLVVNLVLSAFKIGAGIVGCSQAVVADGVHSISDLATDIMVLVGVRYWSEPPDRRHPYGHGRIETLITTILAGVLIAIGLGLGWNAIASIPNHRPSPPGAIALAAAIVSMVSKEVLYQWSIRVGRTVKSQALVANAWHHRSDALSSIPAAIAVAAARFCPEWAFLDAIGAILVTLLILQAGLSIGWPATQALIDRGAPEPVLKAIAELARSVTGVRHLHAIRTRSMGHGWAVDLHVLVNRDLTVEEGHNIAGAVKRTLLENGPDIVDVIVHIEPAPERIGTK